MKNIFLQILQFLGPALAIFVINLKKRFSIVFWRSSDQFPTPVSCHWLKTCRPTPKNCCKNHFLQIFSSPFDNFVEFSTQSSFKWQINHFAAISGAWAFEFRPQVATTDRKFVSQLKQDRCKIDFRILFGSPLRFFPIFMRILSFSLSSTHLNGLEL